MECLLASALPEVQAASSTAPKQNSARVKQGVNRGGVQRKSAGEVRTQQGRPSATGGIIVQHPSALRLQLKAMQALPQCRHRQSSPSRQVWFCPGTPQPRGAGSSAEGLDAKGPARRGPAAPRVPPGGAPGRRVPERPSAKTLGATPRSGCRSSPCRRGRGARAAAGRRLGLALPPARAMELR